ncbi:MAG TPA: type II secretion system secretin GspD [Candidatus Tectomicrobia bacterium]|nr:type II secretion system secretin GspD [Candidatus Tectomicrobia bacterium]
MLGWVAVLLVAWVGTLEAVRLDSEPRTSRERRGDAAREASGDNLVSLDFDNVDLKVFIKYVSEITGRNFVVDDKVRGRITLISPTKIRVDELERVLESLLELNGFTAVPSGSVTKIVPLREVKQRGVETDVGRDPREIAPIDRMVTHLVPLRHADINEVRNMLTPLVSKDGNITAYGPSNTIILTDLASNVSRLVRIIQEVDIKVTDEQIVVVTLKFASAIDLAPQVTTAVEAKLGEAGAAAPGRPRAPRGVVRPGAPGAAVSGPEKVFRVIADPRSNALIIVAGRDEMALALDLVEKLDVRLPPGRAQIHVYYLENAVAEDLAKVLTAQAQELVRAVGQPPSPGVRPPTVAAPAPSPPSPAPTGPTSGVVPTATGERKITITPDKATNALVITAIPEDYQTLAEVIRKLDIPRRQVYVEAAVIEISLEKTRDLGVEFRSTSDFENDSKQAFGGTSFGLINEVARDPFAISGLAIGIIEGTITFGGVQFLNIGALVQAIQRTSDVNVLSTPHLLTTDNQEAEIVVASNIPFVTATSQTTVSTLTSVERKDVGIILRFTPQVSEGDKVTLKIFEEISAIQPTVTAGIDPAQVGPTTSKRTAKTTVVVDSKQTIVIGGLFRDDADLTEQKVPCIGDIPLLGKLFGRTQNNTRKTNLVIFLTPHIVRTAEDLKRIKEQVGEHHEKFKREQEIEGSQVDPTRPVVLEPAPAASGPTGTPPARRP